MNMLNNKFKIAKEITCNYVLHKKNFTLEELNKEILDKGGLLRINPGITIKETLGSFVDMGILKYDLNNYQYIRLKSKILTKIFSQSSS